MFFLGDIDTNLKAQLVLWAHLQREMEHRMQIRFQRFACTISRVNINFNSRIFSVFEVDVFL